MTGPRSSRAAFVALVLLAAVASERAARAAESSAPPRLVITPAELSFSEVGESRALTLTNAGGDVLRTGGISVLTFGLRASATFLIDAPGARELEPGASATIHVTYRLLGGAPPTQVFAALLVPADDPDLPLDVDLRTGASVARHVAGVAVRVGQTHLLTWMIFFPLLGLGLLWLPAVARSRHARTVAALAAGVPLALAGIVAARFDPTTTSADGNDGLQLVAHLPLGHLPFAHALGVEYFVGVDGLSVLLVLLAPLVGLVAIAATRRLAVERTGRGTLQALLLVQVGATGVFAALDGALLWLFWSLAVIGMVWLVGARVVRADGRSSLSPFALAALTSAILLLLALVALRAHTLAGYLCDGTPARHTLDLMRLTHPNVLTGRLDGGAFGLSFSTVVSAALFVAFALVTPLFPFHGWAAETFERAPSAAGLVLAGLVSKMGLYGLVRLNLSVLPEATRAASTLLLVVGVLGALQAALLAAASTDLRRLFAHATVLQLALCLLGLASLTPAGLSGALTLMFAHGLAAALFFSVSSALGEGGSSLAALDGLWSRMPRAARWLAVALLASLAAPGLATFVGPALVIVDASARHPAVALAALAAYALATGAHLRFGKRVLARGPAMDEVTVVARDLDGGDLVVIVPLATLLFALGLVPASVLDAIAASVLDLARLVSPR
jgi:NADH-quinone oxidoreductase subunit M